MAFAVPGWYIWYAAHEWEILLPPTPAELALGLPHTLDLKDLSPHKGGMALVTHSSLDGGGESRHMVPAPTYRTTKLYDYLKYPRPAPGWKRTGTGLYVNGSDYLVIDIDKKSGDGADRKLEELAAALCKSKDIVVKTGGGGYHIYLLYDLWERPPLKNRYVAWLRGDGWSIDIFFPTKAAKQSFVVIPPSTCKKNNDAPPRKYTYADGFMGRLNDDGSHGDGLTTYSDFLKKFKDFDVQAAEAARAETKKVYSRGCSPTRSTSPTPRGEDDEPDTLATADIRSEALELFGMFRGETVHADYNRSLSEEISLYHLFGTIWWCEAHGASGIFDEVVKMFSYTEKAREEFDGRKRRYDEKKLMINPSCLKIRLKKRKDVLNSFEGIMNGIYRKLQDKGFVLMGFDKDHFTFYDFSKMGKDEGFKDEAAARSALSRVLRFSIYDSSFVLKKEDEKGKLEIVLIDYDSFRKLSTFHPIFINNKSTLPSDLLTAQFYSRLYVKGVTLFTEEEDKLNIFTGWQIKAKDHGIDLTPFLSFVEDVICQHNKGAAEYLLSWFARIVQQPGEKNGSAVLLLGDEGTGKTTLANTFCGLLGRQYSNQNLNRLSSLTGRFNHSFVYGKVLTVLNEVGRDFTKADLAKLKSVITEAYISTEKKFAQGGEVPNYQNILITTNEIKKWALRSEDRRFLVLEAALPFTDRSEKMKYFDGLYQHLNDEEFKQQLMYFFTTRDLSQYRPEAVPETEFKKVLEEKRTGIEDFVDDFALTVYSSGEKSRELDLTGLYNEYIAHCQRVHQKPVLQGVFSHSPCITRLKAKRGRVQGRRLTIYRVPGLARRAPGDYEKPGEEEDPPEDSGAAAPEAGAQQPEGQAKDIEH